MDLAVYPLRYSIGNPMFQIGEDIVYMLCEHLSHGYHWLKSRMGSPEIPPPEEVECRFPVGISPEGGEGLLHRPSPLPLSGRIFSIALI